MKNNTLDPIYLFHNGVNYEAYKLLSPSPIEKNGKKGWIFRTYAPNAHAISIVGSFNNWDEQSHPMYRISDGGIWEGYVEGAKQFDIYKYRIVGADDRIVFKADPYCTHAETPPHNASKLFDITGFKWTDNKWMTKRASFNSFSSPINIYEVHIGSWKKHDDGNPFSYKALAEKLIPYVKDMGYTHIELMPITEYPFDGSWGYQVTGMFAPTSRYGTPHDFMYFINECHRNGIGVFIDWVGAHFPKDEFGLYKYDGTFLYEYEAEWKREHKEWGTVVYDYEKKEVNSFLISSANMLLKEYHIDGLRMDAVASMLYLDYAKKNGEWQLNKDGTRINLEAQDFIKHLNSALFSNNKGIITMAEESTSFPMVTKPPFDGGLGFSYKWNMGWMNDTLDYVSLDPIFRQNNHNKLTFSLTYAYSENYILPLSHDEVVHGKCSLINKMPGYYEDKFRGLKTLLGYQMSFVGKKLNFMGNEFAQFIEWKFSDQLDWFLLDYESHRIFKDYVKDLNLYYLNHKEFYEQDNEVAGFEWTVVDDNTQNIIAYKRYAKNGDYTLCVMNFSPMEHIDYRIGVDGGTYVVELNSESEKYGGQAKEKQRIKSQKGDMHGKDSFISLNIKPNCVMYIKQAKARRSK